MTRKGLWLLVAILAIVIGLYPSIYFLVDREFGLLGKKSNELLADVAWNTGFYTHIIFGGLSLFIGWTQFNSNFRNRYISAHRGIGIAYVIAVALSSLGGVYIGFFATGGLLSSVGFICLGIIWFTTTIMALVAIRKGKIADHQTFMIYSYAACFSAVTLRIWLPLLILIVGDFSTAYTIVAWLCWVPNLFVARLITKKIKTDAIILN